jgi:hypothetical protein
MAGGGAEAGLKTRGHIYFLAAASATRCARRMLGRP